MGYLGMVAIVVGIAAAVYADGQLPAVAEQVAIHGDTQTNAMRLQKRDQNLAGLRAAGVVLVVADYLQDPL